MREGLGRGAALRAAAALAIPGLVACTQGEIVGGGTKQMAGAQVVGGFLPDPSQLQPGGPGQPDLLYRNPQTSFASYHQVMLEPVQILTDASSALNAAPPEQRQALAQTFYTDLSTELHKSCQIAAGPGPGTLKLHFALVNATTPNATVNTVATYAPYVNVAYKVASLGFHNGVGYFSGTATVEFYASDAANGTVVFQAVAKRGGTTALVANTFNDWRDVDNAFQAWAQELVAGLKRNGACS